MGNSDFTLVGELTRELCCKLQNDEYGVRILDLHFSGLLFSHFISRYGYCPLPFFFMSCPRECKTRF